ncbi:MAG: hypothetical protein VB051_10270 [Candidatus Pelethousia sp.]|nr:hypothetical protein [Candidatus Pelethousia sp.]
MNIDGTMHTDAACAQSAAAGPVVNAAPAAHLARRALPALPARKAPVVFAGIPAQWGL